MDLADKIRVGSTLKPQGRGEFLSPDGCTCAMGAALDAIGRLTRDGERGRDILIEQFPIVATYVSHPSLSVPTTLLMACFLLNDRHGWTREQIADFVESVELQQPV